MSRELRFTKGQGTGNDFIVYSDPEGAFNLSAEAIAAICDRQFGVGADGVIRAIRSSRLDVGAAVLAEDASAEWFMDYRNADGSVAEMCGNGIRVYLRYLLEQGLLTAGVGDVVAIGTRVGVRRVTVHEGGFEVDLGVWRLNDGEPLVRARGLPVARPGLALNLGNPHVVVALADEEELAGVDLTRVPILDPEAPDGANIEFVVPAEPLVDSGYGRIRMRVHERGSGETLSCGTGAAAAALAVRTWAGIAAPKIWKVQVPGGVLGVRMWSEVDGEHVSLRGPAELVFDGVVGI